MLKAKNYYKINDTKNALDTYKYAAKMIPSRFLPLYYQFDIFRELHIADSAKYYAKKIVDKPIKIQSFKIKEIKSIANTYLNPKS
jgi:hypothetical protein